MLSVHLVLSERSRGLVDAQALDWMKPGALLVNTARGPIVDEAALIKALQKRKIAAAALDVFDQEPLPELHPFRTLDNVLATPHVGYVSRQNYQQFFSQMIDDIQGGRQPNPNPQLDVDKRYVDLLILIFKNKIRLFSYSLTALKSYRSINLTNQ